MRRPEVGAAAKRATECMAQDWHPEDIKAALRKSGVTLTDLAKRHGFARTAVSVVAHRAWPRMQQIIARQLRLHPMVIWPSRYDAAGRPLKGLRSRRAGQPAPTPTTPQRQKGAAA